MLSVATTQVCAVVILLKNTQLPAGNGLLLNTEDITQKPCLLIQLLQAISSPCYCAIIHKVDMKIKWVHLFSVVLRLRQVHAF